MRSSVLTALVATCTLSILVVPSQALATPAAAPPAAAAPPSAAAPAPAPAPVAAPVAAAPASAPPPAAAAPAAAPVVVPEGTTVTTAPGGATIVINNAPTIAPTVTDQAAPTIAAPAPAPAPKAEAAPPPPRPAPAPVTTPPPARPMPDLPENNGVASLVTGLSILGSVYALTALVAARRLDEPRSGWHGDERDRDREAAASRALLIPVVGPFIAMPNSRSHAQTYGLALNGSLQVGGLVLTTVGAVLNARYNRAKRWQLTAATRPGGATAGVQVRF